MIPFNKPAFVGNEIEMMKQAIAKGRFCGDGEFTRNCQKIMEQKFSAKKTLLTTSCTHSLEMAAILAEIGEGDEVIMPSYTFVSTANAFALRGAKIVFVDIRPDTMNIDEKLIEAAITTKTKVIVPVHYAGVACEMDEIMMLAKKYNLIVVEDAAQGVMSTYKNKYLGTIGDIAAYSFHETKNYTCGEGGALIINNEKYIERAEIIREKGTNRARFFRGEIDKYTWVDIGSSYLMSDFNAAYLYGQFLSMEEINNYRKNLWNIYNEGLKELAESGKIELPFVPDYCEHNAHMYYVKLKDLDERTRFLKYMKDNGILAIFHYIPLHSAEAGLKYGEFRGEDKYTTKESERIARLPMYYGLEADAVRYIVEKIKGFWG